MHPDQNTPESHRYSTPDSNITRRDKTRSQRKDALSEADKAKPESEQEVNDEQAEDSVNVRTPEPDGKRTAEAGNQYMGRQMDDDLQSETRPDEGEE
ncbi:hypothetical protein BH23BAC4_BH23BAC4_05600 [soil metagenome]